MKKRIWQKVTATLLTLAVVFSSFLTGMTVMGQEETEGTAVGEPELLVWGAGETQEVPEQANENTGSEQWFIEAISPITNIWKGIANGSVSMEALTSIYGPFPKAQFDVPPLIPQPKEEEQPPAVTKSPNPELISPITNIWKRVQEGSLPFEAIIQTFGPYTSMQYDIPPVMGGMSVQEEENGEISADTTLIVETESLDAEDLPYVEYMLDDSTYVLNFEKEEKAEEAREKYEARDDSQAFYDDELELFADGSGSYSYISWGAETIGAKEYNEALLEKYGTVANMPQVKIAVIDSGMNYSHPLISGRIQSPQRDYYDEDGDAYDDRGHGTKVAGIIADLTLPNVRLMNYKITNAEGRTSASRLILAIRQAIADEADMINLSIGGDAYETIDGVTRLKPVVETLYAELDHAVANGIFIVVASGNDGKDASKVYPAAYPNAVTVAALDTPVTRADYSNYGPVVFSAPGSGIYTSSMPDRAFGYGTGTSMAAPHVCAAIAMTKTMHPDYSMEQVLHLLQNTAVDLGEAGYDGYYGYGKIHLQAEKETFLVRWENEDGTLLAKEFVEKGEIPVYQGEEPQKEADENGQYFFSGWDPAPEEIQEDSTYIARYEYQPFVCHITWKNDEGEVLAQTESLYGDMPEYPLGIPQKEPSVSTAYEFISWEPKIKAATEDREYTTRFRETVRKYQVQWQDENGTLLREKEVPYGELPVYTGRIPGKPADGENTYYFSGWEPETETVTGPATYTATYSAEPLPEYTISWASFDGTILKETRVTQGQIPYYDGEDPSRNDNPAIHCTFAGWEPRILPAWEDAVYTAQFTEEPVFFTAVWQGDDGTVLQTDTRVPYGEMPVFAGSIPTKEETLTASYAFAGWSPEPSPLYDNACYTATFRETPKTAMVFWYQDDGTLLYQEEVPCGTVPFYEGVPYKEGSQEYAYQFTGWSPAISEVYADTAYTATYEQTEQRYWIHWLDEDGTELLTMQAAFGDIPVYEGTVPCKENSEEEPSYVFAGWYPNVTTVGGEAWYTATFVPEAEIYPVQWVDDAGNLLFSSDYALGDYPVYGGETPWKADTAENTYAFTGWVPEPSAVTGPATYTARFTKTLKLASVQWLDENGNWLDESTVPYGTVPEYHGVPLQKQGDLFTNYTFSGWYPQPSAVYEDTVYQAVYEEHEGAKPYVVRWLDDDGTVLIRQEYLYGDVPAYPVEEPTAKESGSSSYAFLGWLPEIQPVIEDQDYHAQYEEGAKTCRVTWQNYDGTLLYEEDVTYGSIPQYQGAVPEREGDEEYAHAFSGWFPEPAPVTRNTVYTAEYREEYLPVYITAVFYGVHGEVLYTCVVEDWDIAEFEGEEPEKESDEEYEYFFDGWEEIYNEEKNILEYFPLFEKYPIDEEDWDWEDENWEEEEDWDEEGEEDEEEWEEKPDLIEDLDDPTWEAVPGGIPVSRPTDEEDPTGSTPVPGNWADTSPQPETEKTPQPVTTAPDFQIPEVIRQDNGKTEPPALTGDTNQGVLWVLLLILSTGALVGILFRQLLGN